jgi:hypothetical protein
VDLDSYEVVHLLERIVDAHGEALDATHELIVLGKEASKDARESDATPGWETFVAAHPELAPKRRIVQECSDEEILDALRQAILAWRERLLQFRPDAHVEHARSGDVAEVLINAPGEDATRSEVGSVAQRLRRLEREGRVVRKSKPAWDHSGIEWAPATPEADDA